MSSKWLMVVIGWGVVWPIVAIGASYVKGRAKMRLQLSSVIAVLSLLASVATAYAERAWILWSQGVRDKTPITWFAVGTYPSVNACRTALTEAAERLQNSGYELVDTAESITAMKDDDNFTGLTCVPGTVDLRGPKAIARD